MSDYEIFELGDIVLQCKQTLRNAKLAYKTYGTLNDVKGQRNRLSDMVFRATL